MSDTTPPLITVHRGHVFPLKPTAEQEQKFRQFADACRELWNLALEQRATWGRSHGCTRFTQGQELTALREEFEFFAQCHRNAQSWVLLNLQGAFHRFERGKAGHPKPKCRDRQSRFQISGEYVHLRTLNAKWSEIKLPKIGWVRMRTWRAVSGRIRNVVVSLTPRGWTISIACEEARPQLERPPGSVGIDRGVTIPMMLSNGQAYRLPALLKELERRHRVAEKVVARRIRGSRRHAQAQVRAAALQARAARVRQHWQHAVTAEIARDFGSVSIEALDVQRMTRSVEGDWRKTGLNRAILNVGWHGIETKLAYKIAERGGQLIFRDPAHTSQACSGCGAIDRRSRRSQSLFVCTSCGHRMNADLNAAINIEKMSGAEHVLVTRGGTEARTCRETSR